MAKDPHHGELFWTRHLDRRIGAVLESIPGHADLRPGSAPYLRTAEGEIPTWVRIPIWLDASWAAERSDRPPGGVLADVLWGQYALFLHFRIQDDLLDGQRDDLRLLFVADRFLLEALESFQRLPELDARFWAFYRGCLRNTIEGAQEVGRLEKEPGAFRVEHLGLHARVSGMAKVGVAAISRLHRHERDISWLSCLQDQLAILNQVGDDLQDLAPDLKGGRYTWVANTLLAARAGKPIAPGERTRRLGEGLMAPERGAVIVKEIRRTVRAAAAAVPESAPSQIHDLVEKLNAMPDELDRSMHEARVRSVFGEALAGVR
jgi:hypothetical protein